MGVVGRWVVGLCALVAVDVVAQERLSVDKLEHDVLLLREAATDQGKFGFSLAVVGSRLAIGKPQSDRPKGTGEAVFLVEPDGRIFATIPSPTPAKAEQFGFALATDGQRLIVGESGEKAKAVGRVHVVDVATGKLTATWEHPEAAADNAESQFGKTLLMMGDEVVVGAPNQTCNGNEGVGAIYRFDAAGKLKESICDPEGPKSGGWFALRLGQSEQQLLVSSYSGKSGQSGNGVMKVFSQGKLVRSVYSGVPEGTGFGSSMVRVGDQVAVGVTGSRPRAAVFLYDPQTWKKTATIESPIASGYFGSQMVAVGDDLLIGEVSGGAFEGTVWLFDSKTGKVKRTFRGHGGFGTSLAVWGNYLVIGAPRARGDEGGVYLIPKEGPAEVSLGQPTALDLSPKGVWAETSSGDYSRVVRMGKVLLAAEKKSGLVRSEDSGRTWAPSISGEVTALAAFEGTAFVALDRKGLFTSTDGGRTWKLRAMVGAHAMDASEYGLVVGTRNGEVLLSKDGGARWQALCLGLPENTWISTVAAVSGAVLFRTDKDAYRADLISRRCEKLPAKTAFWALSRGGAGEVVSTECDVRTTLDGKRWTFPAKKDDGCKGPQYFGHTTALTSGDSVFLASDVGHLLHKRGAKDQLLTKMAGPDSFGTRIDAMVLIDDAIVAATPKGLRRYRFADGEAPASTSPANRLAELEASCGKGVGADCATWGEWLHFAGKKPQARAALLTGCEKGGEVECALWVDLVLGREKRGTAPPELLPKLEKLFTQACQRGAGRSCWRRTVLMAEADAAKMQDFFKKGCAAKVSDPESCEKRTEQPAKPVMKDPKKAVAALAKPCLAGDDVACRILARDMATQEPMLLANPELGILLGDRLCRESVRCEVVGGWVGAGLQGVPSDRAREFSIYERYCYQNRAVACYLASALSRDNKIPALRTTFTNEVKSRELGERAEALFVSECNAGDLEGCLDWADHLRTSNKGEAMKLAKGTCEAGYTPACGRATVWALNDRCNAKEAQGCLELAVYEEAKGKGATYITKLLGQACQLGSLEACTKLGVALPVVEPPGPRLYKPKYVPVGPRFAGETVPKGQRFRLVEVSEKDWRDNTLGKLIGWVCTAEYMGRASPGLYKGTATCSTGHSDDNRSIFQSVGLVLVDERARSADGLGRFFGRDVPKGQRFWIVDFKPVNSPLVTQLNAKWIGRLCVALEPLSSGTGGDKEPYYWGEAQCDGEKRVLSAVTVEFAGPQAVPAKAEGEPSPPAE